MPGPAPSDIGDLLKLSLQNFLKGEFEQIATELQDYVVMRFWLGKDRVILTGGNRIQRTLMVNAGQEAEHTALFNEKSLVVEDHAQVVESEWHTVEAQYGFDEREILMNRDPFSIVGETKMRNAGMLIRLAELMEERGWAVPASTDKLNPLGIPYWVVWNATDGFTGATPSGHTTVGGLSPTTWPNHKNYAATYTDVTKADLVRKMRKMHHLMKWRAPTTATQFRSPDHRRRYYTGIEMNLSISDLAQQQNDSLGPDVARYDGETVFFGHPMHFTPILDDSNSASMSTALPVYAIDHSKFETHGLKGGFLVGKVFPPSWPQPHVHKHLLAATYSYICRNRRMQGVIAKSDPMA